MISVCVRSAATIAAMMFGSGCTVVPTLPAVPIAQTGTVPQPLERSLMCAQTALIELGYTVEDAVPSVFLRGTKPAETRYVLNKDFGQRERNIYHVLTVQTAPKDTDNSLLMVTAAARIEERGSGVSRQTQTPTEAEHDAQRILEICAQN